MCFVWSWKQSFTVLNPELEPNIENHGAQTKKKFSPHALWEGDGKQMKIFINGKEHVFCWYAFCDQRTTLLVGSNIEKSESAENFLKALKAGKIKGGVFPIGVVIDNRFQENDRGAVEQFCKQHNITIVRIFPGNSKSNGIIENNFSIYESFVGNIRINGTNEIEIAHSIALAIAEIYTQQRNHTPRKRLLGDSPEEYSLGKERPEHQRTAVEKLACRLKKQEQNIEEKWKLIEVVRNVWFEISPESENKIKREIAKYPVSDLIAAIARYLAQKEKHPENYYGPEYFLAILRHKRESIAKSTYNEQYRSGILMKGLLLPNDLPCTEKTADKILDELLCLNDEPSPSHVCLKLDALCFWLANYSGCGKLPELWQRICRLSEKHLRISSRWWQQINEYISEKIGEILYGHSSVPIAHC